MRRFAFVASLILLGAISSCSEARDPDPYAADLEQAKSLATSRFQRAVLQDEAITRSEYEEAVHRYVSCGQDGGVQISAKDSGGGYYTYVIAGDKVDQDAILESCAQATINLIEPIFVDQLRNPDREDFEVLIARCLIDAGAAPKGYGARELQQDLKTELRDAPFTDGDPAFERCMTNPSQRK